MPHIPVFWIVIAALAALVVLVLQTRLRIFLDMEDSGFYYRAYIGPIELPLTRLIRRQPVAPSEKAPKKAEKSKKEAEKPRRPMGALIEMGSKLLSKFSRRIRFEKLHLRLVLGGEDPADTARLYGYACILRGLLTPVFSRVRDLKTHLGVDFDAVKTEFCLSAVLSLKLGTLLALALSAGWQYLRVGSEKQPRIPKTDPKSA